MHDSWQAYCDQFVKKIENYPIIAQYAPISVVLLFLFLYHTLILWRGHPWGWDASLYVDSAINLCFGEVVHHFQPDGFPIFLAGVFFLTGPGTFHMQIGVILCFIATAALLYFLAEYLIGRRYALCLVVVTGLSPEILYYKGFILSEFLFMSLITAVLVLEYSLYIRKRKSPGRLFIAIVLGLCIGYAMMVRSSGMILIPALFGMQMVSYMWSEKPWDRGELTTSIIPYISIVGIYSIYLMIFGASSWGQGYSGVWSALSVQSIIENIAGYGTVFYNFLPGTYPIQILLYGLSLPFFLFVLCTRIRSTYPIFITIGLFFLLHILYPAYDGTRFMLPIYPLYLLLVFLGITVLQSERSNLFTIAGKYRCDLIVLLTCFALIFSIGASGYYIQKYEILNPDYFIEGPDTAASQDMFRYISVHTDVQDRIGFRYPGYLKMYTGRDTQKGTPLLDDQPFLESIYDQGISYILIEKNQRSLLQILNQTGKYSLMYENSGCSLYKGELSAS